MKKYNSNDFQLKSPQLTELMTKIPSSFIRWGITAIFFVFCILIAVSAFVPYSETIQTQAQVRIENNNISKSVIYIEETKLNLLQSGQTVFIKFHAFPYEKYGIIQGQILSTDSLEYYNSGYFVPIKIILPEALKLLMSNKIQVNANAEIEISKTTFLKKILNK